VAAVELELTSKHTIRKTDAPRN